MVIGTVGVLGPSAQHLVDQAEKQNEEHVSSQNMEEILAMEIVILLMTYR